MTLEVQRLSMPVPKPTLSAVIIDKIREGASLEETKQYYAFLREIQRDEARIQFDADFVVMQGELPEVPKLGRIDHGGGRGYNYARWEDINDHIKPVLQRHGFGLNFDIITENETLLEMEAILRHRSGYSITVRKKLPIDKSGSKNIVQAYGSTQSYCQRYAAIALLNLTSRNEDSDAVIDKTNGNGNGHISPAERAELDNLLDDAGADDEAISNLCTHLGVRTLDDLRPRHLPEAKQQIAIFKKWKAGQ